MCKLTHESLVILAPVMFDAGLNSLSDETVFKEGHFEIRKTLLQNTIEIGKFSLVIDV